MAGIYIEDLKYCFCYKIFIITSIPCMIVWYGTVYIIKKMYFCIGKQVENRIYEHSYFWKHIP